MIHIVHIKKGHGKEFIQKLEEIQSKVDFKIPLTEDNMDVSDKIKTKSFDCISIIENNTKSICVFINGFFDKKFIENGISTNLNIFKERLGRKLKLMQLRKRS